MCVAITPPPLTHTHTPTHTQPTDCNPLGGLSSVTNFEKGRDLLLKFSNLSTDGLFSDTNGGGDGEGGLSLDSITKGAKFFCGDIEGGNQSLGLLLFSALYGNDYQQSKEINDKYIN